MVQSATLQIPQVADDALPSDVANNKSTQKLATVPLAWLSRLRAVQAVFVCEGCHLRAASLPSARLLCFDCALPMFPDNELDPEG